MGDFDLQIKGGTVVDGTRVPRYRGDVWIKDGRIAYVGPDSHPAGDAMTEVIDAEGMTLLPGLIDGHTHIISRTSIVEKYKQIAAEIKHEIPLESGMKICYAYHGDQNG